MDQLDRITQQPEVMGGKACIRGLRVTVGTPEENKQFLDALKASLAT